MVSKIQIAVIEGDGIGVDVTQATIAVLEEATKAVGGFALSYNSIAAGAGYYSETGVDIEPGGEDACGEADAILLGAIGLPNIRYENGTEISPHLRLREKFQLYAGIRPVKAYPNSVQKLADPRAANIDLIILRESTEGLFYSAAVHNRSQIIEDLEVCDTLKITRATTEKLHNFAFRLAEKRKQRGGKGQVTCVDKANVFNSMAFFRKIFDEIAPEYPDIQSGYNYVDAQALDLIRKPWDFDVLVMENMFGDILSDLGAGIMGGLGFAPSADIGVDKAVFQPCHGSAPDIAGQGIVNPTAMILSTAMMLEWLGETHELEAAIEGSALLRRAVDSVFEGGDVVTFEHGGKADMKYVFDAVSDKI